MLSPHPLFCSLLVITQLMGKGYPYQKQMKPVLWPPPQPGPGPHPPHNPSRWQGARHPLGTPDTRRSGLSTRNARRAFTSKPPFPPEDPPCFALICSRVMVKSLKRHRKGREGEKKRKDREEEKGMRMKAKDL